MINEKDDSEQKKKSVAEKSGKVFTILFVLLFSAALIASPILLIFDFEKWVIPVILIWTMSLLFYLTTRRIRH